MTTLYDILVWLHVFSAASWFGALMLFAIIVGPTIGDLTPSTSHEVVVKMLPRYLRFIAIFTVTTPILGLVTALASSNGSFSVFSPSSGFGMWMSTGALLSLVLWVVTFVVVYPTGRKIVRLTMEVAKNQAPQPPGLPPLAIRLKISSGVSLALLIAILTCMVAAAL